MNSLQFERDEQDRDFEANAPYDYKVEAYGDRCQCGSLRWGGDCPDCTKEDE